MSARKFDRYMLVVGAGTNPKLARLTDSEWRCHIGGVLAVAATSPIRGCLFVGEQEAEPIDIATAAGVTERVGKSCLAKLKAVDIIYRDEDLGCWRVHDWDDVNPEPKADPTAAERARRYRERRAAARNGGSHATVTPASRRDGRDDHALVTPPEVEGEEDPPYPPRPGGGLDHGVSGDHQLPPGPPPSGQKKRDRARWERHATAFAASVLPHLEPRQAFGEMGNVWLRMGADHRTGRTGPYEADAGQVIEWIRTHRPQLLDPVREAA